MAAAMGAFPIRISDPQDPDWTDLNLDGLSILQGDSDALKAAITRVVTEDKFVDDTALHNAATAHQELSTDTARVSKSNRIFFEELLVGLTAGQGRDGHNQ